MAGFSEGAYRADLAAVTGGGGALALANPEGRPVIITALILNITTKTTAACTLDAGIAADATTSADGLIDGLDANAAAGTFTNIINAGSNGKAHALWGASQYLTVSEKTGAIAGLVGEAIVEYIVV